MSYAFQAFASSVKVSLARSQLLMKQTRICCPPALPPLAQKRSVS
jgi:hypothetical protein